MDDALIAALRTKNTKDEVEKMFAMFGVKDIQSKIDHLDKAMYADQVFYSIGNKADGADILLQKYNITLGMFIDGSWRIAELYDKLGLPEEVYRSR